MVNYVIPSSDLVLIRREESLFNKLRVDFLLRDHIFNHNWHAVANSLKCPCGTNKNETTIHYLLDCPLHSRLRNVLFRDHNLGSRINNF